MKNPDQFVEKLKGFKEVVDSNLVPASNVMSVKSLFICLDTFKPEVMETKSPAAKGVCNWVINIVKYWEVI
jgi:dynein heavy chain